MLHRYSNRALRASPLFPAVVAVIVALGLAGITSHANLATAQEIILPDGTRATLQEAPPPKEICELEPQGRDEPLVLTQGMLIEEPRLRAQQAEATSEFSVQYDSPSPTGCEPESWPAEAIEAFEEATAIWSTLLKSDIPIRIRARWEPLGANVLGSAGPTTISSFPEDDPTRGIIADTWYPVALANALSGEDAFDGQDGSFDINVNISCNRTDWHFDVDSDPPSGTIDLLTVVLHEIGHGVGIIGSMSQQGGGAQSQGSWGIESNQGDNRPLVYDTFAEDGNERLLIDETFYANPSTLLFNALTGNRGGVFFNGPLTLFGNRGDSVPLFAPSNFRPGSSFSHVDQTTFTGTDNALMRPQLPAAQRIATPGPVGCGILADMGWPLGPDCFELLDGPPLLVSNLEVLTSEQNGGRVTLNWNAEGIAREFIVEEKFDGLGFDNEFRVIDRLSGQDRSLLLEDKEPGQYHYRIRQVAARGDEELNDGCEATGTEEGFPTCVTGEVTVFVSPQNNVFVKGPGPNPFSDQTSLTIVLEGETAEHVRAEVFNAAGQRVRTLINGEVDPGSSNTFQLDGSGLASGTYFIQITGPGFNETRSVTLIR